MRRVVTIMLPLLILSAASFAQGQSASGDAESSALDFLKELSAAADPEPEPEEEAEAESSASESAAADDQEEDAVAESGVARKPVVSDKPRDQQALRRQVFFYTAIGLDVVGAGLFAYGIYENSKVAKTESKNGKEYLKISPAEAKSAATKRNLVYTLGTVLLASGITIHILF
ncbi:MAG: hypothetical protein LBC59_00820 [Chitinispirillales bacterium]|jgi:hypothetical protein|nr:hypothetical protein [Chitinispirillales bacterium]